METNEEQTVSSTPSTLEYYNSVWRDWDIKNNEGKSREVTATTRCFQDYQATYNHETGQFNDNNPGPWGERIYGGSIRLRNEAGWDTTDLPSPLRRPRVPYTIYPRRIVEDPTKIVIIPDVYARKYEAGWNHTVWSAVDDDDEDDEEYFDTITETFAAFVHLVNESQ